MTTAWQPHATFGGVVDVSHNNGVIDWAKVPAEIALVFVKATQGAHFVDPRFAQNRDGARKAGKLVVPYHFLDSSPVPGQLANLMRGALPVPMGPVMIDWEVEPRSNLRAPVALMQEFGEAVQRVIGRAPLAYHGMYDLSNAAINAWPWFVPKYGPQPQGPHWLLWQNTPNLVVPGIPNKTDHSIFAGTIEELKVWHATGAMPKGFR